ncbi:MAG: PfkB family carbohydrate kinase [Bacillota bacterium]|nr:PfkB family carbohydrate kinase [Bacillota bacterium]
MSRPVLVVTLLPALDLTVWVERLRPGATHLARGRALRLGGKGLNVARVARGLGAPVHVLGLAGRDRIDSLRRETGELGAEAEWLPAYAGTRTNLKLVELDGGRLTEVNEAGLPPEPGSLEELERRLLEAAPGAGAVVLTGSLPPRTDAALYGRWIERLRARTPAPVLVDAHGEALARALEAGPFLIKPNRQEAAALVGHLPESPEQALAVARTLSGAGHGGAPGGRGTEAVLLSLGRDGAAAGWHGEAWLLPAEPIPAEPGAWPSTVGAGDAMVARMAVELARLGPEGVRVLDGEGFLGIARAAVRQAAEEIGRSARRPGGPEEVIG